jgi:RimJ/RimL family protein N-acetyltransferase
MSAISFTPLARNHLPLLHDWLNREHIRRWWHRSPALEEVEAKYMPRIDGSELARVFLIELDGRPAGMIQTYLATDDPEWIGSEPGVAGVDLFIADEDLLGQGLGPRILIEFMQEIVYADPATTACAASPEVGNAVSIRAFEKAGFIRVREIPGEHGPELLLRAEREAVLTGNEAARARRTA